MATPATAESPRSQPQPLRIITEFRDKNSTDNLSPGLSPFSPRQRRSVFRRSSRTKDDSTTNLVSHRTDNHTTPSQSLATCRDSIGYPHSRTSSISYNLDIFQAHRAWDYREARTAVAAKMAKDQRGNGSEEHEKLIKDVDSSSATPYSRESMDSITSASTTSLVLENLNETQPSTGKKDKKKPMEPLEYRDDDSDPELPRYLGKEKYTSGGKDGKMSRNLKRIIWIVSSIAFVGWALALAMFVVTGRYKHSSKLDYDHENPMKSSGKKVTMDQLRSGEWQARFASVSWIPGANGEDGLMLEIGQPGKDFFTVEDVRSRVGDSSAYASKGLMKTAYFSYNGRQYTVDDAWVSPDMKNLLLLTKKEKNFRHSYTGLYFILDVSTQQVVPLDATDPEGRIQLAQWSPTSDSVAFTRDNNLYLRMLSSTAVRQVTKDGGSEYFYGIPDWVYEEEVFANNIATWWARDGQFVAFLRTNETIVPEYPVQYFLSRPSGKQPEEGLENYPEVRQIKYPKAGAPNPVVDMLFYDVARNEMFSVDIADGFPDDDRLIINVLWADNGKVLIEEGNRVSDHVRYVLVDVVTRTGKTVRRIDLSATDGGWVEPAQQAVYVPADPANGRPNDGYIDITVYEDNDHLAYYSPLDSSNPVMLTKGKWEVEGGKPPSVDLKNNLVHFIAAKESPTQRHVYSVKLDGTDLKPLVPADQAGYWAASFSSGSGYVFLANQGPGIPFQKIISTPTNPTSLDVMLEDNTDLKKMASAHELPHKIFQNVTIDDFTLQVVEQRPPHFDPQKRYPVLFYLYGGPGSQTVNHKFHVDFQSYIASNLGYIVVTVDGRGTGYIGRKARTIIREHIGRYEAKDQIETAKIWAAKSYVDADRMAIWGWSYGGFMTLKVLETDAGQTFKYGMAVAPVTDWRFYDSVYTERYMRTPQQNPLGYEESAITNVTALSQNVRFLIMHGIADDNVHMQNTLTLLDRLDVMGIENYDLHMFPDSDHSIYFHNANAIVYDKLRDWLVNAFNGVWYKTTQPKPE